MQLKEIITSPAQTVAPDCTLLDAAKTMMSRDLGWLPVADNGKVVGIITDRDITIRGVAGGLDSKKTKVEDVMTKDVFCCSIDSTIEDAANLMEDEQVRRLVVVDENEKIAGVVSLADLALDTGEETSHEVLKEVSKPS
jgi:CBS domain-containing protein